MNSIHAMLPVTDSAAADPETANRGSVLICGASIAGPCLAFWLNRAGFKTTIVERASKFRDGGQNIDVKGAGQIIVERMGLLGAIKARTTAERGLRFVDSAGATIAEFPKEGALSMTQEIEILRGDLSRVFYDATRGQTEYRFGVSVVSVKNQPDSIGVDFSDGSSEVFDFVVSAEGNGSVTRRLVMDQFVSRKYLGFCTAYFRIPKLTRDVSWARWYNAVGGLVILMRPSTADSESVSVDFRSDDSTVDGRSLDTRRDVIRKALDGVGFEGARISENLDFDDDFYVGPLVQVKASRWSVGRFVLVGDAAYGPSAVTGMGTTLAITGAYVLAGELAKSNSGVAALASYEQVLRPFVEKAQRLPPGVPWIAHPKTRLGIGVLNSVTRAAASKPVQTILRFLNRKGGRTGTKVENDGLKLPSYEL